MKYIIVSLLFTFALSSILWAMVKAGLFPYWVAAIIMAGSCWWLSGVLNKQEQDKGDEE